MDFSQLRYVVAVADSSSFTRAAERCFVTQSALSHQIAALERELGQRLFVRSSRSVRETEAGTAFVARAREALRAIEGAKEDAAATAGQVVGTLRLGVIPTVTAIDVPAVLARFRAEHPSARVELRVGNSDALVADVRAGNLDVAFLGLREDSLPRGVAAREIGRERLVAAVPATHVLASRSEIGLTELAGMAFADFPAGTSGRAQSDVAFVAAGVERDVAFEADSAELLIALVAADLAVSLLAPAVLDGRQRDVIAVPVREGPIRIEYVAWDSDVPRSVARAFLRVVEAATSTQRGGPGIAPGPASQ
ncbi:LysR family transcriptional regulator [Microbacterium sp. SSW1-49]|uniref:LysR family transcriptional regulator n=1 Tax=Microbacterium croceum TaxID=2851645 RepID=A0ABT0FEZ3_9MICO|nr:LysR substrate-binding domain-containing protein [Microbacterium croceum]MCK2036639.1 LysR family transcriptional regulator [Microbacterium croceum]